MIIKTCIKCGKDKPHQAKGFCKSCYGVHRYLIDPKRKAYVDANNVKYRKTDKCKKWHKAYYAKHRERIKTMSLAWYHEIGKHKRKLK